MKKKFLSLLVALSAITALGAADFEVDGIAYYTLGGDSVEVTSKWLAYSGNITKYSGNITIPATVTYESQTYRVTGIGHDAFKYCSSLTSVTIGNSVTSIGYQAFYDCTSLASVTIGNSVTGIVEEAFYGCTSLTSITIPNSVKSIGSSAFRGCSSLTSITIPNSVTSIGNSAFYYCTSLTSVTIGNSVTSIGYEAFSSCRSLTSVTIPNSVTSIGQYAFKSCTSLTSITIPNSVKSIGNSAFYDCTSLMSITIPNSVKSIGSSAFYGCTSLTSVTLGAVTSIGNSAFYGCKSLASVTIPNSVMSIGSEAFCACALTSIQVNAANTHYSSIDGVLFNYAKDILIQYPIGNTRTSYTIPNSVTSIGNAAFKNCTSIVSVTLGDSVTSIGSSAFESCRSLKKSYIGKSVKTIESYAFNDCNRLDTIIIYNNVQKVGNNAFCIWRRVCFNLIMYPLDTSDISSMIKEESAYCYTPSFNKIIQGVSTSCESPTCATIVVDLSDVETSQYAKMSLNYKDIEYPLQSGVNTIFVTGLKPNATDTLVFRSQLIGSTEWRNGCKTTIHTSKLELTTLQPKVPTAGEAIVCATTNIADAETKAGFEWRKYNAPAELPSSSAYAYVFNGSLQGKIKNLSNEYYKTRAFYEAADGTRYYGEWQTFDPTESSYFDPEVHTYYLPTEPTSKKVTVRGLVTAGTDAIVEQGFEYWPTTAPSAIRRVSNDVKVVHATGQAMTATLDSLNYSTSYECRAFAKTATTTIYGEQISFVTPEDPRPIYTLTLTAGEGGTVQATPDAIYREGDQVTITATANDGYNFVQWSDMITTNPRTIIMDANITLEAIFEAAGQAIDNVNDNLNLNHNKFIRDGILLINRNGIYYNAQGAIVE